MISKSFFTVCLSIILMQIVNAQISNDDCADAILISNSLEFCGEYSNENATPSVLADNSCWINGIGSHDVWFQFVARRNGALVRLFGESSFFNQGRVEGLGIQVYSGDCNNLNELSCFPSIASTRLNELEIYLKELQIGQTYYIRVDAFDDDNGDFELCIRSFNPRKSPEQDCPDGVILCDTGSLAVEYLTGGGLDDDEAADSCLDPTFIDGQDPNGPSESASVWYVFECLNPGELIFSLTPNNQNNPEEDLDFVVYELPNGIGDCSDKIRLRCMAAGISRGLDSESCLGATGLRSTESDITELAGCEGDNNNFVASIMMTTGTAYGLIVNNFSDSEFGFTLSFEGTTGTFVGPQTEISIDPTNIACDQEITFTDNTVPGKDGIVRHDWNFGEEAVPFRRQTTEGPHTIRYESFGQKVISLLVESANGCQAVDVIDLDVLACCDPRVSTLDGIFITDTIDCPGTSTGVLQAVLSDPGWQGVNLLYNGNTLPIIDTLTFQNLPSGDYSAILQDKKGCEVPLDTTVYERPPIVIDAGDVQDLALGTSTFLDAYVDQSIYNPEIQWSPPDFVDCRDCPNTEVMPVVPTRFILTATNRFGCTKQDSVLINIQVDREAQVYTPDAFTPNDDGNNDFFKLFGGIAVESIEELNIFNRWGNLVYQGTSLSKGNDLTEGWDGVFNGEKLPADVYAWVADVLYIDGVTKTFSGSLTLIQ